MPPGARGDRRPSSSPAARTLIDLMKRRASSGPRTLVDINALPLARSKRSDGGIRIGALARMSDVARATRCRAALPGASPQALLASASPQLRNMASIGGNLMQRTRCPYFRDAASRRATSASPAAAAPRIDGDNRCTPSSARSDHCIATHPSDLAVALAALDAVVTLRGPHGRARSAVADFHLLPGDTPHLEHALRARRVDHGVYMPDAAVRAPLALPQSARPRLVRVRRSPRRPLGLDLAAARGPRGAHRARRRRHEAVAGPRRRGGADRPARRAPATTAADAALAGRPRPGRNDFKIELAKRTLCAPWPAGRSR